VVASGRKAASDMLAAMFRPNTNKLAPMVSALLAAAFLSMAGVHASATGSPVITLEALKTMFAGMRADTGHEKWNVDGDLLWGYFFTDPDPRKLQSLADYLAKNGYHYVNIYPTDDKRTFFLHVERIEHHTPESLNQRNVEFYKLVKQFHVDTYDGMDVGPVE
jgi:hypothetical protein